MRIKSFLIRPLTVAALFAVCGVSHAAITVFTTAASFAAATSAPGVDTYAGFSVATSTPGPINRNAGAYTYDASTSVSDFFGAGTIANPSLSTDDNRASITFSNIAGDAMAIGGNFYGTDVLGNLIAGAVTIVANDSFGAQSTQTITSATVSSFLGFLSTGTISSLVVTAVQPSIVDELFPAVDNLTIAISAPVPEPETYALMLTGLGVVGFVARRRRN